MRLSIGFGVGPFRISQRLFGTRRRHQRRTPPRQPTQRDYVDHNPLYGYRTALKNYLDYREWERNNPSWRQAWPSYKPPYKPIPSRYLAEILGMEDRLAQLDAQDDISPQDNVR